MVGHMTEPIGYVLTPALDGPDMLHLNPSEETKCGGRSWGKGTIKGDRILYQQVDEKTALDMLNKKVAVACRRCGLKDQATEIAAPKYAKGHAG